MSAAQQWMDGTDVNDIVSAQTTESCVYIGAKNAADDITEMWHVIDIRQCARNQHIATILHRQYRTSNLRLRITKQHWWSKWR